MGDIVLAGSTSGTTTLTPTAVSGTTTLTLPATTGTFITTTGGVTPSTSGNLLTSNGTSWTSAAPAAAGGMTLLGTLTTTSGTTQTLSSLTLTNYKFLVISINNVGYSTGDTGQALLLAGVNLINASINNTYSVYGPMWLDLSHGGFMGPAWVTANLTNSSSFISNAAAGNLASITTATTTISFTWTSSQAFSRGTIKVYGAS